MKALTPALFLLVSNVFMTFAWYGHLKWFPQLRSAPLFKIILISWGIALLEYCFQVPGNRAGERAGMTVGQLKIMQEVITLSVFVVFSLSFFPEQKLTWNYFVAFALMGAAAFFVFFKFKG